MFHFIGEVFVDKSEMFPSEEGMIHPLYERVEPLTCVVRDDIGPPDLVGQLARIIAARGPEVIIEVEDDAGWTNEELGPGRYLYASLNDLEIGEPA